MGDKKSVLIINRSAPYGSSNARESMDIALTCAIFEMPVSLLFIGAGIYQLLKQQEGKAVAQKNLEAMLSALPMYDIENIYVSAESMTQLAITPDELCLPVQALSNQEIAALIKQQDSVLSF